MTAANNPPTFTPEKYTTIASNHLVVYSIHTLYKDGDEISAEDIISSCFKLFPKKFSLRTYPQWPDSALVGRRLHDCEKSGWLIARIETGFKLTAKGTRLAERVARELGVAIPRKEKPKQVDKLRVAEAKTVGELQVHKLQLAETAGPAPVTPKPEEEAKTPVVEAPKAVEKVVAPVVKIAPIRPKPAKKAKTPAVEKPKAVEKKVVVPAVKPAPKAKTTVHRPPSTVKAEKRVNKLQVAEVVKPAPVKPKPAKKAKAPVIKAPKPAKKVKKKQVDKLQVTEVAKPAPVVKPAPAKPKVEKIKEKQVAEVKVAKAVKLTPVKPKPVEKAKAPAVETPKPAEKKAAATVVKPAPIKPKVAKKKEKRVDEVKVTEVVKPAPKAKTTVHRLPSTVKVAEALKPAPTTKPKPAAKPKAKVVPPSVAPRQLSLLPTVSAEEKARAGKFVKMMEASDAYRMYKKNGANANIGEFDFRSLLLCTMESSHETLARNVELFKGYAGTHNRQDLTVFLGFCADKFAHLLVPEKKAVRKLK